MVRDWFFLVEDTCGVMWVVQSAYGDKVSAPHCAFDQPRSHAYLPYTPSLGRPRVLARASSWGEASEFRFQISRARYRQRWREGARPALTDEGATDCVSTRNV